MADNIVDKAYQSLFTTLSGYSKDLSNSYRGGIIELASRLDSTIRTDRYGRRIEKYDLLSIIKEGQGELANWKTDTRMQQIRDTETVVNQYPKLELAANTALEAMCDSDTVEGTMKFNIQSKNQEIDAATLVKKLEDKYQCKYHLRNTVYKQTLTHGEFYPMIKPISEIINYAFTHKDALMDSVNLFEAVTDDLAPVPKGKKKAKKKQPHELKLLYESAETLLRDTFDSTVTNIEAKNAVNEILEGIVIQPSYEKLMFDEFGDAGMEILAESYGYKIKNPQATENLFEGMVDGFSDIEYNKDEVNKFDSVKGCYVKWLNATQVLPIRVGSINVGYYYIHYSNTNISNKTSFANGVVDISQTTTLSSSKDFMQQLSNMLVTNLDLPFIKKHSGMVDEIAAILMENQFRKRTVSFTYIPKEDIIPFKINVDTEGNGNSMFARSIFNARLYTMLMMNNIITLLNNRPTRTYKVKRDPRTNNIASVIQQFKEKIYSKRIGVDDVWSYNGAMNKIGSPTDMVIPVDADGTPPFTKEYDEGATIDLNAPLMDMLDKNAVALTGVPNATINQQDEVEYSKLAQMAQLKLLDFIKGLKIDFNTNTTLFYRRLMELEYRLKPEQVEAITVTIPDVKSNDINIISEMIQTFNTIFETLITVLLTREEAEVDGKPSNAAKLLKYELMKIFIPSIDYTELDKIKKKALMDSKKDDLTDEVRSYSDFQDDEDIANALPQGQQ